MVVKRTDKAALILLRLKCRRIRQGVHRGTKNHQAQQTCRDSAPHRSSSSLFQWHPVHSSEPRNNPMLCNFNRR
jgi:hypothetical protein